MCSSDLQLAAAEFVETNFEETVESSAMRETFESVEMGAETGADVGGVASGSVFGAVETTDTATTQIQSESTQSYNGWGDWGATTTTAAQSIAENVTTSAKSTFGFSTGGSVFGGGGGGGGGSWGKSFGGFFGGGEQKDIELDQVEGATDNLLDPPPGGMPEPAPTLPALDGAFEGMPVPGEGTGALGEPDAMFVPAPGGGGGVTESMSMPTPAIPMPTPSEEPPTTTEQSATDNPTDAPGEEAEAEDGWGAPVKKGGKKGGGGGAGAGGGKKKKKGK